MRNLARGVIAASMLLGAAGAAQAAENVDAQGFSAQLRDSYTGLFDMAVLADTGNVVKLSLSGVSVDDYMGGVFRASSQQRDGLTDQPVEVSFYNYAATMLNFQAKAGYRIESFTLTGTTIGALTPAVVPADQSLPPHDIDGAAGSYSEWQLTTRWGELAPRVQQHDVAGSEAFSLNYKNMSGDSFYLIIQATMWLELRSAYTSRPGPDSYYTGRSFSSSGSLDTTDLVLTVNLVPVAAVPEPGTYAMLLTGLALLGVAARRRK